MKIKARRCNQITVVRSAPTPSSFGNAHRDAEMLSQKKNPSRENIFPTLENNFSTLEKNFSRLGKKFSTLENFLTRRGIFLTRRGIFLTRHLFSTPSIPVNAGWLALIKRRQEERIFHKHR
ncbi:MAG: hypothetical protein PUI86_05025, partial [Bacteroidales bacterium]|nr:hypothetical protein [Bacteroidales bacterium]